VSESVLEVAGLAFAYDGALAVRDVSLTVQPGEIVDSASHANATQTQMGTGYFAEYRWPYAAYQRLLRYQNNPNGAMADYNGAAIVTDSKEYDAELHMNSGTNWRSYFWFGGPGAV
jgi:hypothetical protein